VEMILDRADVAPDTTDRDGRSALSWATERGHTRIVEILLQRCSIIQDTIMANPASQIALTRISEKQYLGAQKRPLESQGLVPQSESSGGSIDPFATEPSELSQRPSKRSRGS